MALRNVVVVMGEGERQRTREPARSLFDLQLTDRLARQTGGGSNDVVRLVSRRFVYLVWSPVAMGAVLRPVVHSIG